MEVSSYPCVWKMEDCLGYCNTGYSAFHGDGFNHGYNQELIDLWKLVQPYGYVKPGEHGYVNKCMQQPIHVHSASPFQVHFQPNLNSSTYLSDYIPEQIYSDMVDCSNKCMKGPSTLNPSSAYMHDQASVEFSPYTGYTHPMTCVHATGDSSPCSNGFSPRGQDVYEVGGSSSGFEVHGGFFLVLQYLRLPELLSMELVCKSLQGWIRSDTSLWRELRVEQPLSNRLTDDALTGLAARAQGYLTSLVLIDCLLISNDAIHEVLVTNLMLSKLHLLWRSQVSADALVRMVQQHIEIGGRKLQQLWIRGLHVRMTKEQLNELEALVVQERAEVVKPQFYDVRCESSVCKDDRCMDVEACPRCGNPRVIYDCTRLMCRVKRGAEDECRGCISCIARCKRCGTCLAGVKYRECFNMELICYECSSEMVVMDETGTCEFSGSKTTGSGCGEDEGMSDSFEQ